MNYPEPQVGTDFEALYQQDADPWQVRRSWYEQRKRALLLACLPRQHYRNAYEPGCGNGELTALLAARCERLLAADLADTAVALTRARLQEAGAAAHVTVERQQLPQDWPRKSGQQFDLILISEIAYYLTPEALALLIEHCVASLAPGGTLLCCHWRPPFKERLQSTARVHAAFHAAPGLQRLLRHEEDDFLLEIWSSDARSVAAHEGLR